MTELDNLTIINQTRPDHDHPSVLKSLRLFLRRHPRLKWPLRHYFLWPLESLFYRVARRGKKVCILRRIGGGTGLMCDMNHQLFGIAYADRKNMLPVVDMRTYPNTYLYEYEVGRVNSWEYYFEQPAGISLDEALAMKDTVSEDKVNLLPGHAQDKDFFFNFLGQLDYWRGICRKYIRFTPAVTDRFERMKAQYEGMRILGVLVRGTDYVTTKPAGHPIPPTADQAIAKAREAMSEQHFDAVYLATEDKKIVAAFQDAFGDKLILPEAQYVDYDYSDPTVGKNWLCNYGTDRPNDKYLSGLEYLVTILFLSRCEGFITSGNNGSAAAMLFSDGFEYFYFFDLGVYQ